MVLFTPSPERGTWYPTGVFCATCKEIAAHNPLLLKYANNGTWMGCLGPLTEVYPFFCFSFFFLLVEGGGRKKENNEGVVDWTDVF